MQDGEKTEPGADSGVFWEGSDAVRFEAQQCRELYEWVNRTLSQQGYERLGQTEVACKLSPT